MLHEPAKQSGDDLASSYKSRLGVRMFLVYAVVYAGFVLINVLWPTTMSTIMHWNMTLILDVFAKSAISCKKSICYLIVGSTNE